MMLGKIEGRRRRGWQRMRWFMASLIQRTRVWANSRKQWRTGKPGMMQPMGSQRLRHALVTEPENFKAHERHLKERGERKTFYSSVLFNLWRKVYKWWPYTRHWIWCWAWDRASHVSPMSWVSQLFNTWPNVCLKGYWEWVRKMCSMGDETWTIPERMDQGAEKDR